MPSTVLQPKAHDTAQVLVDARGILTLAGTGFLSHRLSVGIRLSGPLFFCGWPGFSSFISVSSLVRRARIVGYAPLKESNAWKCLDKQLGWDVPMEEGATRVFRSFLLRWRD